MSKFGFIFGRKKEKKRDEPELSVNGSQKSSGSSLRSILKNSKIEKHRYDPTPYDELYDPIQPPTGEGPAGEAPVGRENWGKPGNRDFEFDYPGDTKAGFSAQPKPNSTDYVDENYSDDEYDSVDEDAAFDNRSYDVNWDRNSRNAESRNVESRRMHSMEMNHRENATNYSRESGHLRAFEGNEPHFREIPFTKSQMSKYQKRQHQAPQNHDIVGFARDDQEFDYGYGYDGHYEEEQNYINDYRDDYRKGYSGFREAGFDPRNDPRNDSRGGDIRGIGQNRGQNEGRERGPLPGDEQRMPPRFSPYNNYRSNEIRMNEGRGRNTQNHDRYPENHTEAYPHYAYPRGVTPENQEIQESFVTSFRMVVAITGLVVVLGVAWGLYRWISQPEQDTPHLIQAPKGSYKIRPDSPGGTSFPYQDTLVYDRLVPSAEKKQNVERLLPQPEPMQIVAPVYVEQQGYSPQQGGQMPPQPQPQPQPQLHQGQMQPQPQLQGYADPNQAMTGQNLNYQNLDVNNPSQNPATIPAYKKVPEEMPVPVSAAPVVVSPTTQGPQAPQNLQNNLQANLQTGGRSLNQIPLEEVTEASTKPYFVQLGTLATKEKANVEKKRLEKRFKTLLGGRIEVKPFMKSNNQVVYRIISKSALASKQKASILCERVKGACKPVLE